MDDKRETDWAEVRELYETSERPVDEIAAMAGISRSTLYRRKRREGWISHRCTGPAPAAAVPLPEPPPATDRKALAERLWRTLNRCLRACERVKPGGGDERTARTLASLTRTVEKLIALEQDLAAIREQGDDASDDGGSEVDVERLLAELAARLEAAP